MGVYESVVKRQIRKLTCWLIVESIDNSSHASRPLISWKRVEECVDQITLKVRGEGYVADGQQQLIHKQVPK